MKVAIDVSPLKSSHRFRGIGAYTKRLVEALSAKGGFAAGGQLIDLEIILFQNGKIPKDCDLIHYPYFDLFWMTLPLIKKKKTVITIHDVIPLVFPKYYPPGMKGKLKFQAQKLALKTVKAVICDSKNSKKDVVKYLGLPKEKIYVVYLAPGEEFEPVTDRRSLVATKREYHLPNQFALYVGDVNYNKNIRGLVMACQKAKIPLVIVGKQAVQKDFDRTHPENQDLVWLQSAISNQQSAIIPTGFVPTNDLVLIYNLATVYCQPSFYEGFGLPVLEAMACGTPVVAANTSNLPEICGDAAIMVDPYKIEDIARGIKRVISDKIIKDKLVKKGLAQAEKFSWEKTARETVKVYFKIGENHGF